MKDSEADIAIGVLNKLIDQELEAVRAATRDGNTPFGGKGEYEVKPNICYEPSFPPTIVYVLEKEAE